MSIKFELSCVRRQIRTLFETRKDSSITYVRMKENGEMKSYPPLPPSHESFRKRSRNLLHMKLLIRLGRTLFEKWKCCISLEIYCWPWNFSSRVIIVCSWCVGQFLISQRLLISFLFFAWCLGTSRAYKWQSLIFIRKNRELHYWGFSHLLMAD